MNKLFMYIINIELQSASIPANANIFEQLIPHPPPIPKELQHLISEGKENEDEDDNPFGLPLKKRKKPSRQMKRFHWKKIENEKVSSSIWKDIDDEHVQLNFIEFELNFQFRNPKPSTKQHSIKSKKDRTGQVYTFLPPQRSQNIQIALSRFKINDEQIKHAIITMDETVFNMDSLEKFVEIVPTAEEQAETEMNASKDEIDPAFFGRSEKFFYYLIDIVDLQLRLELWLFKLQFAEIISNQKMQILNLEKACVSLKRSSEFRDILQIILAFGNHMNGGTSKGQAYGFDLNCLRLMSGVKSLDSSMSLMMYLYKILFENHGSLLDVHKKLKFVKVAAQMETDMIDKSVKKLKDQMHLLAETMQRWEEDYEDVLSLDDKFICVMKIWQKKATKKVNKVLMMHRRTRSKCKDIAYVLLFLLF